MPKFQFSLQVLLKYREDMEQRERDTLMRIMYSYQLSLRHRDELERKLTETRTRLSREQAESPEAGDLEWYRRYMNRLIFEIEQNEKQLVKLDSEVREQKKVVIEAVKKRKVLSALRAKREREFNSALDKKEQKEVDEWVAAKYAARPQSFQQQIP